MSGRGAVLGSGLIRPGPLHPTVTYRQHVTRVMGPPIALDLQRPGQRQRPSAVATPRSLLITRPSQLPELFRQLPRPEVVLSKISAGLRCSVRPEVGGQPIVSVPAVVSRSRRGSSEPQIGHRSVSWPSIGPSTASAAHRLPGATDTKTADRPSTVSENPPG